jgi:hypothetical protein
MMYGAANSGGKSGMPSKNYDKSDQPFEWQVYDAKKEDLEEVIESTGLLCKIPTG